MGELGFCTINDIVTTVATSLLSDITTDGGIPLWLVRVLHNKAIAYFTATWRCYFLHLDVTHITQDVSPILIPFIIGTILIAPGRKYFAALLLLFPLFLMINPLHLPLTGNTGRIFVTSYFFSFLAVTGAIKLCTKVMKR